MKAIEILKWICRESINGELLNTVDVPEEGDSEWEQNEGWWKNMFGNEPGSPLSKGTYLYFYDCDVEHTIKDSKGAYVAPDALIEISKDDNFEYIYLYKVED